MAINIFELFASLNIDNSQFLAGVRTAQQNMQQMTQNVSNAINTMNTNITQSSNTTNQRTFNSYREYQSAVMSLAHQYMQQQNVTLSEGQRLARAALGAYQKNVKEQLKDIEERFNKSFENIGKFAKKTFETIGKWTAAGIGATTTAAVAFVKKSVSVGQQFDSAMSQVAATMGTTVDNIQGLREFAQKMGDETAFSASQAAEALNYMALAGYNAETSMKMLPNVLNLAAAGGMELARASDMITDTQSALGLSLEQTEKLVDQMAKASSKTNTSVSQLGEAMLTVGGTAKTLAGGTTELSTVLGLLADNDVKGSEGGTALRNIILALLAPTNTAAKAIKKLGVEVFDSQGNMRDLQLIFADFNKTLSTMSQGDQTKALSDIFNKVDLKPVNALLATNTDRWNEVSNAIDEAKNSAGEMANTQLDNLTGNITHFQSALEAAQIAISDKLTPTLNQFVKLGANSLSDLTEKIKTGNTKEMISVLKELIKKVTAEIIKNIPQFVDIGVQLFSAIISGIIENLPLLVDAVGQIFDSLVNALQDQFPVLEPVFDILKSALSLIAAVGDSAGAALKAIWDNFLKYVVEFYGNAFMEFMKGFADVLDRVSKSQAAVATLTTIIGLITSLTAGIKAYHAVMTVVQTIQTAVATSGGILNAIWAANPVGVIVVALGALIAVIVEVITYWDYLVLIWEESGKQWKKWLGDIGKWFSDLWNDIVDGYWWFIDRIVEGAEKIWNDVTGAFSKVGEFFGGLWNNIVSTFSDIGIKVGEAIGGAFKDTINGILWTVEGALNMIPNAVNGMLDTINKLPGVNISAIPTVTLPRLAQGGVLRKGQTGFLEGDGDEAVVPLSQNTEWIDRVADKISEKSGNSATYIFNFNIDNVSGNREDMEDNADLLMQIFTEKMSRRGVVFA